MREERVFHHIPYLPLAGGLMLLLGLPLPIIAGVLQQHEPNWFGFVLINGLGLVVIGSGLFFIVRFNGRFHYTSTTISRVRFGHSTTFAFRDIIRLEKHNSPLVPYLRLHTTGQTMDITNQVIDFTTLEQLLRTQLSQLQDNLPMSLPITLYLPARFYLSNFLTLFVLILFLGGLLLMAASSGGQADIPGLMAFCGGFMGIIVLAALFSENGDPYKLILTQTAVIAHYLHKTKTIPTTTMQQIMRERHTASYKGFQRITYPIVITQTNGKKWVLEERRIWAFGYTPQQLLEMMQYFYDSQDSP